MLSAWQQRTRGCRLLSGDADTKKPGQGCCLPPAIIHDRQKLPGPRNRKRLVFLPALLSIGAEGESRTPTPLPELDPEPSVSTNSTTSARKSVYRIRPPLASFFLDFSHFLFFRRKIKKIQTAPTGFPAENGRTDAAACGRPHGSAAGRCCRLPNIPGSRDGASGRRHLLWRCGENA